MGRLGFNLVRSKESRVGAAAAAAAADDCEGSAASSFAAGDMSNNDEEEEEILQAGKYVRHQEPVNKVVYSLYLMFLISTTVVACFCVFVVIPQLVDYFTVPKVLNIENSICAPQKQSVIDLLDTERSRRNQERLEIMHKVNALQRNYKLLQIQYRKAQEMFLKKLHNAYKYEENVATKSLQQQHRQAAAAAAAVRGSPPAAAASSSEQAEMEIFELDNTTANIHEDKSERPTPTENDFA